MVHFLAGHGSVNWRLVTLTYIPMNGLSQQSKIHLGELKRLLRLRTMFQVTEIREEFRSTTLGPYTKRMSYRLTWLAQRHQLSKTNLVLLPNRAILHVWSF